MKVKRYDLCGFESGLCERELGDWVVYEDYEELQAEYARLHEDMLSLADLLKTGKGEGNGKSTP